MSRRIVLAVNPIRLFQRAVPRFLGMISAKTRMRMVVIALTRPNHAEPKTKVAWRPTPAAPMVLAMVLSDRIAARGLEVSVLYFFISVAGL